MRPRKQPSVAPAERLSPKILGSAIDLPVPTHYHSRHRQSRSNHVPDHRHPRSLPRHHPRHPRAHHPRPRNRRPPRRVHDLVAQGKKKIILNLADVDYIDSSGVGELVACFTTVRNAGGELKLLNLTQKVHDVLHVTKLYTVFDIKDDEFTAVKSFDYFFAK